MRLRHCRIGAMNATGPIVDQSETSLTVLEVVGLVYLVEHGRVIVEGTVGEILGPRMGQGVALLRHGDRKTMCRCCLLQVEMPDSAAQTAGVC